MNYAPDLTTAAIKMVTALGVVLLIVWGLYRLAKGRLNVQAYGGRQKQIRIVESQYVGVKKSIAMVQVPGSILVVGVGTDSVNLLTQIDDPEVIHSIRADTTDHRAATFKEHLKRFTHPKTRQRTETRNENAAASTCEP